MGHHDIEDARGRTWACDLGPQASGNHTALAELFMQRAGLPPTDSPVSPRVRPHTSTRGFLCVSRTVALRRRAREPPQKSRRYWPRWAIASWRADGLMRKTPV